MATRAPDPATQTADELAEDARWKAERQRLQARASRRMGFIFGTVLLLIAAVATFWNRHPPRLNADDDPLTYLRSYGDVRRDGDGLAIELDPARHPIAIERAIHGLFITQQQGRPWELYTAQPSDALRAWAEAALSGEVTPRTVYGHALQIGDVGEHAPGLRDYFAARMRCPSNLYPAPQPCDDQQIDSHWIVLIDR
jgi:hypothetical protein